MSMFICRIKQRLVWWRYEVKCYLKLSTVAVRVIYFYSPGDLHHCHSEAALSWLLLAGQSSHQNPHLLGEAAAVGAIQSERGWPTTGRCQSPRQQGPPIQLCDRKATERDRITDTLEKLKNLFIFQMNAHSHMWTTCSPSRTASSI